MSKPRIEDVNISESDKENLMQVLNSKTTSRQTKHNAKKKAYGGLCAGSSANCTELPTKNIIYKIHGIDVIERFCDECYQKNEKRIKNFDRFR
jgi:hypothetical protein